MSELRPVRVRVPATSANLGPGFDALGLALQLHDEVEAWAIRSGVEVSVAGEGADSVSRGEGHLVVRAARATFDRLGVRQPGLALRCTGRIPHGRGLGSSAAAVTAGVLVARAMAGDASMTDAEVFALAAELEGHPDNVAACLSGGVAVAWREDALYRYVRVEPHPTLVPVVFVPENRLPTERARELLPTSVPHRDAAATAGRAALLVTALTRSPELLFDATVDKLHQHYRSEAIPHTAELLAKLRAAGIAAVISGAGPTILALAQANLADSIEAEVGTGWHVHRLGVDSEGARVQETV